MGLCLPHGVDFTLFHLNTAQEEEVRELGCECRSVYVAGLGRLSPERSPGTKLALGISSRCLHEGTPLAHPSVSLGKPMSGTQAISCHLLSPCFFAMLTPSPSRLTCHHACDSRRGIAALSTGGDVGWVSRQRGPHHLSPW